MLYRKKCIHRTMFILFPFFRDRFIICSSVCRTNLANFRHFFPLLNHPEIESSASDELFSDKSLKKVFLSFGHAGLSLSLSLLPLSSTHHTHIRTYTYTHNTHTQHTHIHAHTDTHLYPTLLNGSNLVGSK